MLRAALGAAWKARYFSRPARPEAAQRMRHAPAPFPAALLLAFVAAWAAPAGAWGHKAHRIVGDLAQAELSPAAEAEAARLLAGEPEPTLAGVANWADDLRDEDAGRGRATSRWHYVNFPRGDCGYAPPRDCPDGQCLVAAINRSFLALSDKRRPDAERREALKFLVHFVGDAHQPLHAGDRPDKGGNTHQVNYRGEGWNLHSTWDTLIVRERGLPADDYAAALRALPALPRDPTLSSPTPAMDWAVESCRIVARGALYPPGHVIDDAYLDAHRPLVERRLREAGRRLAAMLNHALE